MTELDILLSINDTLTLWFYVWLLFQFLNWARRIIAKWKKGHGDYSE